MIVHPPPTKYEGISSRSSSEFAPVFVAIGFLLKMAIVWWFWGTPILDKWINPTYPTADNQGYSLLRKWITHQVHKKYKVYTYHG